MSACRYTQDAGEDLSAYADFVPNMCFELGVQDVCAYCATSYGHRVRQNRIGRKKGAEDAAAERRMGVVEFD